MATMRSIIGFLLVFTGVLISSQQTYAVELLGEDRISCVQSDAAEGCRISWNIGNMAASEKYRLERYDHNLGKWNAEQRVGSAEGVSEFVVSQANLYRVSNCGGSDKRGTRDCSVSSIYWSPFLSTTTDEIPSTVTRHGSGDKMGVSKGQSLRTQLIQYNVYLLAQALEGKNLEDFPAMTPPADYPRTLVDWIHLNVHALYEGERNYDLGIPEAEMSELPDAVVIHPLGHPELEHSHDEDGEIIEIEDDQHHEHKR